MRFAQPQPVDFLDPITQFRVTSKEGRTEVFDPTGGRLWSAAFFTGHDRLHLSVDGHTLVTSTTYPIHYGTDQVLATVHRSGTKVREVKFADLFDKEPRKLAAELRIDEIGGGWFTRDAFYRLIVAWSSSQLVFELHTRALATFPIDDLQPSDTTEAELLAQLRAQPLDPDVRAIYADWLEQGGFDLRCKVMRAELRAW